MKTYIIYFTQINQTNYEVEAENEDDALEKATELWQDDNKRPEIDSIEETKDE